MHRPLTTATLALLLAASAGAQNPAPVTASTAAPADTADDPVRTIVARLDLEKYKATIKGLTQFGDRRQGTKRNRDAVDWIEAQLKSYGCANVERIIYQFATPPPRANQARPADPNAIPTAQG